MKYDRIVELKKQEAQKNLRIAKFEVENMLKKGESINVTVLSERTGFSRSYFYRNREAAQLVKQAQKKRRTYFKDPCGYCTYLRGHRRKINRLKNRNYKTEARK